MTVLQIPSWPNGENGKVLLHFTADCSVDALWEDFFGSYPELQAKLHKQRNDSNCAESPWVSDRSQLPVQQFVWPAPPAGADPGTPAEGTLRKVRFDAASSLASKAFNSEEIQKVQAFVPGSHCVVESEVYTNAMYGDQFCVMSRTTMVAQGQNQCQVHLVYAVDFKPSLSRLMKPMVAKGVDGGIRGSFATLKKLLQEQYKLTDLPDTAPPPAIPGVPVEAPAAAAPTLVAAPPVHPVPAAAPAAPPLLGLADYIVYQQLVASILRVPDPHMIAKGLAMFLTLLLIHVIITALRPLTQACSAAATAGGSGYSLAGLVCWPFVHVIDIPDSVSEVVGAMLLVAVTNKLLVVGAEVLSAYLSSPARASVTSSTPQSAAAADAVGVANGIAHDLQLPQTAAATAQTSPGKQAGPRSPLRGRRGKTPSGSPAKSESNASSPGGGGGGDALNVMANLGNVMSGWGRSLMNGAVMDEGLQALMSGAWARGNSPTNKATAVEPSITSNEPGPGSASVDGAGSRVGAHNRTTSFTAVMDPSGLNIIEDYAQTHPLLQVPEESRGASPVLGLSTSTAATPTVDTPAAQRPGSPGSPAAAAAERTGSSSSSRGLPSASGSPSSSRTPSPSKHMTRPSSRLGLAAAAAAEEAAAQQPLLRSEGEASGPAQNEKRSSSQDESAKSGTPRTPNSAVVASEADAGSSSKAASETGSPSLSPERSRQTQRSTGKAVKFHNEQAQTDGAAIDKSASSFSVGRTHCNASSSDKKGDKPLGRRSASPLLFGAASGDAPDSSSSNKSPSRRSSRGNVAVPPYEVLAGGDVVSVAPGDEDEDVVVVEVFEHERVQPFRGWGHTWPGHFLPSDKVGHWGDRSGAPGGQLSMLFDRVAPKLPVGWTWKDEEWTVDMTGSDVEGCDSDGWSYGMDFSWLSWPPAPQSGKPGMKSFVRRRRWIRTRERLPPDSYAAALAAAAESADQAVLSEAQKALSVTLSEQSSVDSVGNASLSTRRSTVGDGGLMGGLGSGLGGLVGADSSAAAAAATAAVASATAMMNRFMKAVTDGQSPVGSLGGGQPAAAPVSASASAPAALAAPALGGSGSVEAVGIRSTAASCAPPSGTATGIGLASPKQVATGSLSAAAIPAASAAAASSHSSSEDRSISSMDSDAEPPSAVIHPAAEGWVGQPVTLNAGPSAPSAQSTPATPAGGSNVADTSSSPATQTQQGLNGSQQQQQQLQSYSVQEAVADVDQTRWTASSPGEVDDSDVKPTATGAAGSDDAGTSRSVLPDAAAAAGAPVVPVGTAEAVTQEGQQACGAAAQASTVPSDPASGAADPQLAAAAQTATVVGDGLQLESGSAVSTASDWGAALSASEPAPEGVHSSAGDAEAGPGMTGDLSDITAELPAGLPVTSLATDQQVIQTARGQSSADDWVWSSADAGKGDNRILAVGGTYAAPVSIAAAEPASSAGAGVGVGGAESSSSSSNGCNQPVPAERDQGGIKQQSGPEAGSSAASEDVPPAAAVTPSTVGASKAGFSGQPLSQALSPAPAAADPPAEPSSSSSSSAQVHVNPGLSHSGVTAPSSGARSSQDGVVPRGRGINKRLNSSGLSRSVSSGRPKLGAVSLRQSEGGLRSAGGSGVLSPTAAAAAAAASEQWVNRTLTDASSSRLGEVTSTGGATAAVDGAAAAGNTEAGQAAVDDPNGLSRGEGPSSEAASCSPGA